MKTLAEQSVKPQCHEPAPSALGPVQPNGDSNFGLVDTTNIGPRQQQQRNSIKRQQQISLADADLVLLEPEEQRKLRQQNENTNTTSGSNSINKSNNHDQNGTTIQRQAESDSVAAVKRPSKELSPSLVRRLNGVGNEKLRDRVEVEPISQPNGHKQKPPSDQAKFAKSEPNAAGPVQARVASAATAKAASAAAERQERRPKQKQAEPERQPEPQQPASDEVGLVKKLTIDCLLYLIKGLIATYDLISQPICYFKHDVARRRREVEQARSLKIKPDEPMSPWRQVDISPFQGAIEAKIDSFSTYDEMMRASFKENAAHQCYGYRQVLEERMSKRLDAPGKFIRQVRLTDYKWCTFDQFERQIEAVRRALLLQGVRAGHKVILFADTRPEWQVSAHALIRLGAVVGTMYSTLGVDGIVHTVNETEASLIITQRDKIERLTKLSSRLPGLKRIIYMESSLSLPRELGGEDELDELTFNERCDSQSLDQSDPVRAATKALGIECLSFSELIRSGLELAKRPAELKQLELENNGDARLDRRTKDSLAVIMYTSGSTGIPKGVLISHGNIMATVKSFSYVTKDFVHDPRGNICTAYLPLAHIFEFCIESVMLYHGVRYGFASPHTLTDKSPGLMPGQAGDLGKLRPTVMIIVPLILDRIVQGIKQALKSQSYFKQQLVTYLIDYKIHWQRKHYETPLVDKLVCNKMAIALGGRARYVICGSAPLSSQTQTFVRAALNINLPQGFGTTETCAATACQLFDDQSTENVGVPVSGAQIKLEPWAEGNYQPDDKPNPRGEIVVGGEMIAHGYHKLEQATKEAFYVDENGTRWYRTGDIGEFLPNGQLKIIDRKKDLVKLQNGEYISLGRVESTLKSNPYTDNFCVYANSNYNYVIALGPANELAMRTLAQQILDEHDRRLSPSMAKRGLGADSDQNQGPAGGGASEQAQLLGDGGGQSVSLSETECELARAELRELLASFESDRLNNNLANEAGSRRGSMQQRPRADSSDLTLARCINQRLDKLCRNRLIQERVLAYFSKVARERSLLSLEVPKKLLLLAEEWTEDKNLVTAALKIRRNFIYKRYESELDQLYKSD